MMQLLYELKVTSPHSLYLFGHDTPGRRGKLISLSDLPFFMKALPKNVLCSTPFLGSSPMILWVSLYLQSGFPEQIQFCIKIETLLDQV
jgi:hypothetical protein